MEEKNKKIILVVVLVVGLFFLAILSGYLLAKKGNKITKNKDSVARLDEKFHQDKADILRIANEENNYSGAINKINQLLEEKKFSDLNQEVDLKLMASTFYLTDSEEANLKKGIIIAKEVAISSDYPAVWRAMALNRLADFTIVRDVSFAKENIFNDIYFSTILEEGDLNLARKRLYEKSLSLYKTVIPYYKISSWYTGQILSEGVLLSAETKEDYLQAAKDNLKMGETLFDENYSLISGDNDSVLVMLYKSYAEAATKLYLLKEFNDSQKIIDSFDKAIAVYEKKYGIQKWPISKNEIQLATLRTHLPALVYSYASSLAVMQKPVDQDKIQSLLGILYDKDWQEENNVFNPYTYLKNQKNTSYANTYSRFATVSLARVDSRFASLLTELGWTKKTINGS